MTFQHKEVSRGARRDIRRHVLQVELTSSGNVDVTRWLISYRVETEVEHEGSQIFRGDDVGTSESVGHVVSEEGGFKGVEDIDTMGLELEGINGFGVTWESQAFGSCLGESCLGLSSSGIPCNCVINQDGSVRLGAGINQVISQEGESVPISVLVGVGGADVDSRSQTDEHGFNWPFELGQQDVIGGIADSLGLESVDSDEREPNSFNVNIMAFIPVFLCHFLHRSSTITLLKGNHALARD